MTETQVVEQEADLSKYDPKGQYTLEQWGLMKDLTALGNRLKATLPAARSLRPWNAVAYAQAIFAAGGNPYRGEIYAWEDKDGKLVIDEGYKILVRWAKRQEDFNEWFKPLDSNELAEGDIGVTCYILRKGSQGLVSTLVQSGVESQTALEIATTKAVGIVKAHETKKDPPKGWTWQQRAEIRALKNALNRAYGMPSMAEIAQDSWKVGDVMTQASDWAGTESMLPSEAEATAAYNAKARERAPAEMTGPQAMDELFGDFEEGDYERVADIAEEALEQHVEEIASDLNAGEPDPVEPHEWTQAEAKELTNWWRGDDIAITDDKALGYLGVTKISEFSGDLEAAKQSINAQIALEAKEA